MVGNKITNKITKASKDSLQKNPKIVTNKHDKEIPKERDVCPAERQKVIDDLRII